MAPRVRFALTALLLAVPTLALAQPGPDGSEPPPDPAGAPPPPAAPAPYAAPVYAQPPPGPAPVYAPPPPAQAESTVDRGIVEDANAGRMWLSPTALTEPAGTWSFSDYELFLAGLSYAATDRVSISATTLLPIVEDMPFWLLANVKGQVMRSGNTRLALQAALTTVSEDGESATAAVLGGAFTYCFDVECHSLANFYVGAGFAHEDQSAVPLVLSGSLLAKVGTHVKLMPEADTGYIAGGGIDQAADGFLAWYGVRFTSKWVGVDLGFMKPICEDCDTGELQMGLPFVSFTYRSFKE